MGDLRLAPAGRDDIAVIEGVFADPEGAGEHSWHGWFDPGGHRRRWGGDGVVAEGRGTPMGVRGGEGAGRRTGCWPRIAAPSWCCAARSGSASYPGESR